MEYYNFKNIRIQKGLSQKDLAAAIGVTQGTIARWECNTRNIKIEWLVRIASALNVDIREFFGSHV